MGGVAPSGGCRNGVRVTALRGSFGSERAAAQDSLRWPARHASCNSVESKEITMPSLDRSATVARIVTEHTVAARVFQRHGIDYCCHGDVTVPQACRDGRLDADVLFGQLEATIAASEDRPEDDPRALSTAALIARIVDRHHGYLRRTLPYIEPIMAKVAKVHGPRDASLHQLRDAFSELAASLGPHLEEEEEVLFPALVARTPDAQAVKREIEQMHEDHLAVGDLLARIRALTSGFQTPEWGCNTYRVLMSELDALEADILRHVHMENHVLAPRFG
jgi:regulator of cell morphogenesis and NO signaling